MGRLYQVPPDMKEKEKIIGGILTLNQFFWLLGGFGLGALFFIFTFMATSSKFAILPGIIGLLSGTPFAFCKKNELPLATYLSRKRKLKKKSHKLINKRKGV